MFIPTLKDLPGGDQEAARENAPQPRLPKNSLAGRVIGELHRYFVEPFVRSQNPPWFDARGAAVGFLVGFACPFGGQVLSLVIMRAVLRFNSIIAFAFTWVSNPLTIIPLYYLYYRFGSIILGRSDVLTQHAFMDLMRPVLHADYFWQSVHAFAYLGWDILFRWWIAAMIVGISSAVIGYVVCYRVQMNRCKRRAMRVGTSYENLLEDLERRLAGEEESSRKNRQASRESQ